MTKKTDAKKIADLEYEIAGLKTLLEVASKEHSPWDFIREWWSRPKENKCS
jgi:hypothetical protein